MIIEFKLSSHGCTKNAVINYKDILLNGMLLDLKDVIDVDKVEEYIHANNRSPYVGDENIRKQQKRFTRKFEMVYYLTLSEQFITENMNLFAKRKSKIDKLVSSAYGISY
jgi:hypothetical protein